MNTEMYYNAWRDVFDGRRNIRLDELIYHYKKLSNDDRLQCWNILMREGTQDLEFVKFVHKHLEEFILEACGVRK